MSLQKPMVSAWYGIQSAMSVPFQSEIDALAEVAKVRSGSGAGLDAQAGSETEQKKP